MTKTIQIIRRSAIAALAAAAMTASAATPADIVVKASLDSAQLEMGRKTALHVEVFGTINANDTSATEVSLLIPDSLRQSIEVSAVGPATVNDLGNGRTQILRDIIIQGFDSGVYTLPPVLYHSGDSAFPSNQCVLKVYPTPVDSLKTINDYAGVVNPRRELLDYLPDWFVRYGWWILLILLIVGAAVYVYIRKLRGKPIVKIAKAKPEEPDVLAMRRLVELRDEQLCQRGEEKQYYTRLTDILRTYLHDRFGINAMEMTSTQIRHALRSNDTTRMSTDLMSRILEMADFVKFAKVRPLPDDNVAAMNQAVKFVDDTRPVPEPPVDAAATTEPQMNKKKP